MAKRIRHSAKEWVFKISCLSLLLFSAASANAQCAMCRAVAEDAVQDGYGLANGLNSGIIFLMGIPYVLLSILFFVFFRKQIGGFFRSLNNIHR